MPKTRLRVAGGSARGIPLAEPKGVRLRPTSGLVREAIFNIIGERVAGAEVLDLYAGTGALGIEALSRGARHATFIEAEAPACQAILQSLARTGFAEAGAVLRGRLPGALRGLEVRADLVFMDPPYNDPGALDTLMAVPAKLEATGIVVYEHGSRYNPPERPDGLRLLDRRTYGDSAVSFYSLQEGI
jgi:16S rRNA (guanine966-N2)-methyltransferase